MPILFSAVAHERTIVEKFATCDGNFMEILEEIVSKIPEKNGKMTYSHGHYLLHHIVENDFFYFCITDKTCQRSRAFLFLNEIKRQYTPLFDGNFCSVLADEMYRYSEDYNTIVIEKGDLDELNTIGVGSSESLLGEKILLVPNPENVEYGTISYLKQTPQHSILSQIPNIEENHCEEEVINTHVKSSEYGNNYSNKFTKIDVENCQHEVPKDINSEESVKFNILDTGRLERQPRNNKISEANETTLKNGTEKLFTTKKYSEDSQCEELCIDKRADNDINEAKTMTIIQVADDAWNSDIENLIKTRIQTNTATIIEERLFNDALESKQIYEDNKYDQSNTSSTNACIRPTANEPQSEKQDNASNNEHSQIADNASDETTIKPSIEANKIHKRPNINGIAEHSRMSNVTGCENAKNCFITASRASDAASDLRYQDSSMKTYLIIFTVIMLLAWLVNYVVGPTSFVILAFGLTISLVTTAKVETSSIS